MHFSTDEEVPPGGVDVSGDDSDVEIVIMDSSDEDQSPEQVCKELRSVPDFIVEQLGLSRFNVAVGDRKLN